eukprot:Rhum_TRINITY_DN14641_c10_g1::Rhum_TRINITY_DN14641_c10_g1_i2::g.103182::m.103182
MVDATSAVAKREWFGCQIPCAEPSWYQGVPNPYYTDGHRRYRAVVRRFVEEQIKPNVDAWIATGYPMDLHLKARAAGVLRRPRELGGSDEWDAFYELIFCDEMARHGQGGVLGQVGINSMALPPIIAHGTEEMKRLVVDDVAEGRKHICLAISEPGAGSDVSAVAAKAVLKDGFYEVTGFKKWITGGMCADYFTTLVRTGGKGMFGLSLLLIDRRLPGVSVRKMETQFDNAHSTTFVTLDKVRVPCSMLIGKENQAFRYIMHNFNHERFVIAASACRSARLCYEEAFKYALQRKTFGKFLIDHQIIRAKLAEMLRQIEALHDSVEKVAFASQQGMPDHQIGLQCALLKVTSTRTFEFCAREASQIFGGAAIVKEGKGKVVERLYREVRAAAIPGGSEEVLLDFSIRFAAAHAQRLQEAGRLDISEAESKL